MTHSSYHRPQGNVIPDPSNNKNQKLLIDPVVDGPDHFNQDSWPSGWALASV
jgi:hypothetical protein